MRTLVTVTLSQSGFEEWALVNVAPIPEMDALLPIIGFFAVTFATQRLQRGGSGRQQVQRDVVRAEPDWR